MEDILLVVNMASPQKENGNTGIANELFEKLLLFDFPSASPIKVWLFIARKTYGFQKKTDHLSLTQIERGTNLSRQTVNESLKWLVKACLLVKGDWNEKGTIYGLNKDYEQWVVNTGRLVKGRPKGSLGVLTHNININNKNNYGVKTPDNKKPMDTILLDDNGDVIESPPIPKKYGKKKGYAKIAVHYMTLLGKTGNALRFFPAIKEIYELYQKDFPEDTEEQAIEEITARIDIAHKHYTKAKCKDWGLGKVAENWNKILTEWNV